MNKFRPTEISKSYSFKLRLRTGEHVSYNWHKRERWHPVGWKPNQIGIARRFGRLHYLACHAPQSIQKKWTRVYKTFHDKHFGTRHASVRYLNDWTCHSWL
jgi:hypothetical protein